MEVMAKWKQIIDFDNRYLISDEGEVYSQSRFIKARSDSRQFRLGKIMKQNINEYGYRRISLCKNSKITIHFIHLLVWDAFGDAPRNGRFLQVDHKDENKLNNHISNLQLLQPRDNCNKAKSKTKQTSKYPGVYYNKARSKFMAQIQIKGKRRGLGYFTNEEEAFNAYKLACKNSNINLTWRE